MFRSDSKKKISNARIPTPNDSVKKLNNYKSIIKLTKNNNNKNKII